MSIVPQSPIVSHSSFPPYLMLCAPKIAGLLCAPKEVPPPPPRRSAFEQLIAILESSPARMQASYDEIDAKIEAIREAYGIRPREIIITGTVPQ